MLRFLERENGTGSLPETTAGRRSLTLFLLEIRSCPSCCFGQNEDVTLHQEALHGPRVLRDRGGMEPGEEPSQTTFDDYDDQDGDDLDPDHSGNVEVGGNLITTM